MCFNQAANKHVSKMEKKVLSSLKLLFICCHGVILYLKALYPFILVLTLTFPNSKNLLLYGHTMLVVEDPRVKRPHDFLLEVYS